MTKHEEAMEKINMLRPKTVGSHGSWVKVYSGDFIKKYIKECEAQEKELQELKADIRLYLGYVSYDIDQCEDALNLAKVLYEKAGKE